MDDAKQVKTRKGLADFLLRLSQDCALDNDGWQHERLDHYLEAISAFLESDGLSAVYSEGTTPAETDDSQSWAMVAKIFLAGKYYE